MKPLAEQRFLVTGGAGYVGSHLVAELVSAGAEVIVFDNLSQGHREAVAPGAKLIVGDLAERASIRAVLQSWPFDAIFHFAANSLVGESMRQPMRYVGDNVANAINLVEAAIEAKVRKLVLSSTCAIFGEPAIVPIPEHCPMAPANSYGESKLMIERVLHWADHAHGLRHACLRYFNAAGAHPRMAIGEDHSPETHLIPIALEVALGLRSHVEVFGTDYDTPDGSCLRDYIHVCDLAAAHIAVLARLDRQSCRYNLGIGRGYSVLEVLDAVRRVTGRLVRQVDAPRRPGDPPMLVADPALALRELDWRPRITELDEIVRTAWAWRLKHPNGYRLPAAAAE